MFSPSTTAAPPHTQPSADALDQELRTALGDNVSLLHTVHFRLAHNTQPELAAQLADQMEGTYRAVVRFSKSLGMAPTDPAQPLQVILFDQYEQYADYANTVGFTPTDTRGFYDEAANRSAFYNAFHDRLVQDWTARLDQLAGTAGPDAQHARQLQDQIHRQAAAVLQTAMRHELAHQVIYNCGLLRRGGHAPAWLAEGLACLLEVEPARSRTTLPVNQPRLERFRQAANDKQLLSLENLLMTRKPPTTPVAQAELFYAESWALCHHLAKHRRRQLADYLEAVRTRPADPQIAAQQDRVDLRRILGLPDPRFERAWLQATLRLQPTGSN